MSGPATHRDALRRLAPAVAAAGFLPVLVATSVLVGTDLDAPATVAIVVLTSGSVVATLWVAERVRRLAADVVDGRQRLSSAFRKVGEVLGSTHDRQAIVGALLETVALVTDSPGAVFWTAQRGELVAVANLGGHVPDGTRIPGEHGIAGSAATTGLVATGVPGGEEADLPWALAMPLEGRARSFGVVAVYGNRPAGADALEMAAALVGQASTALENTFLHDEAQNLAITDGLTGLWNRRQLELVAQREVERSQRFGETFAVVIADLDHFKAVNDTHGHQVGDGVLVEVAQRLTASTRDVDTVARYGGEEFVLLLPKTDLPGAAAVAEKVRARMSSEPFDIDGTQLPLTISAGVAVFPQHGPTFREVVAAADEALYQAKNTRDRVVPAAVTGGPLPGS